MNDAPRQHAHLDATLDIIGERIDERIDERERTGRRRRAIGIGALIAATLASGSVAAVALVSAADQAIVESPPSALALTTLRCVDGVSTTDPAFLSVTYRAPDDADVDARTVCGSVRSNHIQSQVSRSTPAQTLTLAESLFGDVDVTVEAATFRPLGIAPAEIATCELGAETLVLAGPDPSTVCADAGYEVVR